MPFRVNRAAPPAEDSLDPSEALLLQGFLWARWIGVATAACSLLSDRSDVSRPLIAWMSLIGLLGAAFGGWFLGGRDLRWTRHPAVLMLEVCLAFAVTAADGWAFYGDHALSPAALATVWSLGVIAAVGISFGTVAGTAAGITAPSVD